MKKLILLLIIATAFASGVRAQIVISMKDYVYQDQSAMPLKIDTTFNVGALNAKVNTQYYKAPDTDTLNYLVIFQDTLRDGNGQVFYPVVMTQKISGFKTQTSLASFLNNHVDSTLLTAIYDVRTKKPLKASFSIEDKVVERVVQERQRNRKWVIK